MLRLVLTSLRSHAKQMGSLVVILSLSLFLIMQQMSTFQKVIHSTYGMAVEMRGVDIWVMAPPSQLMKVKNLEGVVAAAPFYKGTSFIRGKKWTVLGMDEYTFLPKHLKAGNIQNLALDGAVLVDSKNSQIKIGNILPVGKTKAVVVGLYNTSKEPILYTALERAKEMAELENPELPFLLIKAKENIDLSLLCQKIKRVTGYDAFTKMNFPLMVTKSYLKTSGFPSHFAWAILLGFILAVGIISTTLFLVCEKLKRNLVLYFMIGAPFSLIVLISLIHCLTVCLSSFVLSLLFSLFFSFSWKVVGMTFMTILLLGSIIPLLFVRSCDRLHST